MRAALLTGPRKIEIREVPDPVLDKETDVLLRVEATGLCGSDVHYYREGRIGDQVVRYPFAVGHECAGIVETTGPAVSRLEPGDRVAVDPAVVCGACDQCLAGRLNTCRRLLFLGTPGQLSGCLSEYIVMPERNCHRLGETMTLEEGVCVEPLSIGLFSFRLLEDFVPEAVAVLGAGPIGLSVILAAKARGVKKIYATDKVRERVKTAAQAGAVWSGNPDEADAAAEIQTREPGLLDVVFECCGDQTALDLAVDVLKPGGRLMILGIPKQDRVSFAIHKIRRKEISLHNVRRQRHCFPEAVALIQAKAIDVRFMATHVFPLEKVGDAFELVAGYRDGVIKAVVRHRLQVDLPSSLC